MSKYCLTATKRDFLFTISKYSIYLLKFTAYRDDHYFQIKSIISNANLFFAHRRAVGEIIC